MEDLTEYEKAERDNLPQYDEKGRQNPATMTDRALMLEVVQSLRDFRDVAEETYKKLGDNPALKMFGL